MTAADVFDEGFAEPTVPRSNGTPVFDAPWQARAHALAVLSVQGSGREWEDFRRHLIVAMTTMIDAHIGTAGWWPLTHSLPSAVF